VRFSSGSYSIPGWEAFDPGLETPLLCMAILLVARLIAVHYSLLIGKKAEC
jgi:hypothetical protein